MENFKKYFKIMADIVEINCLDYSGNRYGFSFHCLSGFEPFVFSPIGPFPNFPALAYSTELN